VQDHVARPGEGQDRGGDRGHARREHERGFRLLEHRQAVLDDLRVRMVEARIDEARGLALRRLAAACHVIEEFLAVLRAPENECRGQEDRRLHRAFRQGRVVAIAEHERLGLELAIAEPVFVVLIGRHIHRPPRASAEFAAVSGCR
jgi:hypothetical protein